MSIPPAASPAACRTRHREGDERPRPAIWSGELRRRWTQQFGLTACGEMKHGRTWDLFSAVAPHATISPYRPAATSAFLVPNWIIASVLYQHSQGFRLTCHCEARHPCRDITSQLILGFPGPLQLQLSATLHRGGHRSNWKLLKKVITQLPHAIVVAIWQQIGVVAIFKASYEWIIPAGSGTATSCWSGRTKPNTFRRGLPFLRNLTLFGSHYLFGGPLLSNSSDSDQTYLRLPILSC